MPLNKSGSKQSVGENIKTEMGVGKPQKQAVAIALSTQRRAKGKPEPRGMGSKARKIPNRVKGWL